jgi:hypothetical protein
MIHLRNPWLLIPGGLLFGEGLLLSYYAIFDRWEDWSFLWPLQVFLVLIVLWYAITRAAGAADPEVHWRKGWGAALYRSGDLGGGDSVLAADYFLIAGG